jgi:pimeloyl-ACP methyl ester carboxylesterase
MKCGMLVLAVASSATIAQSQTTDGTFNSKGVNIHYSVTGTGSPVILLHPFAASGDIWQDMVRDLSRDHQVIAPDARGHGRSDKPHDPKQYGVEMANDLIRLMDHLGIAKAAIVGYSMGGSVAMKALIDHPDRVRVAVIGGSLGFNRHDSEHDETPRLGPDLLRGMPLSEAMLASAPPNFPKPSPQQREMMKRMDAAQDPIALGAETVSHEGLWVEDEQIAAVRVPTLIINGGLDRAEYYKEARTKFRNLQFETFDGLGHGPAMASPLFLKSVRRFLDEHQG